MKKYSPEQIAKLKAEAKAPYRGLRKFIYVALGGSGAIGAFIFATQLLAGRGDVSTVLGNLGIQIGAIALMVTLFRLDKAKAK